MLRFQRIFLGLALCLVWLCGVSGDSTDELSLNTSSTLDLEQAFAMEATQQLGLEYDVEEMPSELEQLKREKLALEKRVEDLEQRVADLESALKDLARSVSQDVKPAEASR